MNKLTIIPMFTYEEYPQHNPRYCAILGHVDKETFQKVVQEYNKKKVNVSWVEHQYVVWNKPRAEYIACASNHTNAIATTLGKISYIV